MKKEDILFLTESNNSLKDFLSKLEIAYSNKNFKDFSGIKEEILNLQEEISQRLK